MLSFNPFIVVTSAPLGGGIMFGPKRTILMLIILPINIEAKIIRVLLINGFFIYKVKLKLY